MLENNFVNGQAMRADGRKFDKDRKTARTRTARMTACVAPIVSRPMGQQLHRVKVWLCEAGDGDE